MWQKKPRDSTIFIFFNSTLFIIFPVEKERPDLLKMKVIIKAEGFYDFWIFLTNLWGFIWYMSVSVKEIRKEKRTAAIFKTFIQLDNDMQVWEYFIVMVAISCLVDLVWDIWLGSLGIFDRDDSNVLLGRPKNFSLLTLDLSLFLQLIHHGQHKNNL